MKKFLAILLIAIFSIVSIPSISYAAKNNKGKTTVKSYKRKDGTRVKAHHKKVHYGRKTKSKKRRR